MFISVIIRPTSQKNTRFRHGKQTTEKQCAGLNSADYNKKCENLRAMNCEYNNINKEKICYTKYIEWKG